MAYLGRGLNSGNYLKLDDISSGFNGSATTFNLTSGGSAHYPGSAFSILVSLGGVIQEPIKSYTINRDQITFAAAPTSGSQFYILVLGNTYHSGGLKSISVTSRTAILNLPITATTIPIQSRDGTHHGVLINAA